jgi:hypothetical protein
MGGSKRKMGIIILIQPVAVSSVVYHRPVLFAKFYFVLASNRLFMLNVNLYVHYFYNIQFKPPNRHLSPSLACFYTFVCHKLILAIHSCIRYVAPRTCSTPCHLPLPSWEKKLPLLSICVLLNFSKIQRILIHLTDLNPSHFISFC